MQMETDGPLDAEALAVSPREAELEAKLSKRTLLLALFVALSMTELLVVIQLARHAG